MAKNEMRDLHVYKRKGIFDSDNKTLLYTVDKRVWSRPQITLSRIDPDSPQKILVGTAAIHPYGTSVKIELASGQKLLFSRSSAYSRVREVQTTRFGTKCWQAQNNWGANWKLLSGKFVVATFVRKIFSFRKDGVLSVVAWIKPELLDQIVLTGLALMRQEQSNSGGSGVASVQPSVIGSCI
ncbi:MAG: hypothetical protein M1825_002561 [Sarcosagium campestre]|nr:MAG: hypothetical protein M1825_002561 [Sarcosagium campestre]